MAACSLTGPGIRYELASERTPLRPPRGARLIAHLVVNIEMWDYSQPMPRGILPAPHGHGGVPDVPNFGWVEYGLRCGMPRLLRLFGASGVPASASINSGVIAHYPALAAAVRDAGWEPIAHGVVQRSLVAEEDERSVIARSVAAIEAFFGARPRGWLGPGLQQTPSTPALLREHGIEYICDWILDDLPTWVETPNGPLGAIPYTLELNDSLLHAVERHPSDELRRRLETTLAVYDAETAEGGTRIVTLGLHPHLIAVPHRLPHLACCLKTLMERGDVVFMTGSQIFDWFTAGG